MSGGPLDPDPDPVQRPAAFAKRNPEDSAEPDISRVRRIPSGPSCGAKRAAVFAAFLRDEVLEQIVKDMEDLRGGRIIRYEGK